MAKMFLATLLACLIAAAAQASIPAGKPISDLELWSLSQQDDLARMEQIARRGDTRAQHWMGIMLQDQGRHVEAIDWFARAVELGHGKSAYSLAFFYQYGAGVPKDPAEAAKWLRRGAILGDAYSQRGYALALRTGQHVPRDVAQAFRWYMAAARQRDSYSYLPVAEMAAAGEGIRRDLVKAYAFARAAEEAVDSSESGSAAALKRDLAGKLSVPEIVRGERAFAAMRPDLLERGARLDQKLREILALAAGLLLGTLAIGYHLRRQRRTLLR